MWKFLTGKRNDTAKIYSEEQAATLLNDNEEDHDDLNEESKDQEISQEYLGDNLLSSNLNDIVDINNRGGDYHGYTPYRGTLRILSRLFLIGALAFLALASWLYKFSTGYYFYPIIASVWCFLTSMYPVDHMDIEPFPLFPPCYLTYLLIVAILLLLFNVYILNSQYYEIEPYFACVNETFTDYEGNSDYYISAYYCMNEVVGSLLTCACVSGLETFESDRSNCHFWDYNKFACMNIIDPLPKLILWNWYITLYCTIVGIIFIGFTIYAQFYSSILPYLLVRKYFRKAGHDKRDTEKYKQLVRSAAKNKMKKVIKEKNVIAAFKRAGSSSSLASQNSSSSNSKKKVDLSSVLLTKTAKKDFDNSISDENSSKARLLGNNNSFDSSDVTSAKSDSSYPFVGINSRYKGGLNENGDKHGKGVFNYENGDKYDGEWKDNKKDGYGTYSYSNGDMFDGYFVAGKRHGKGHYVYAGSNESYKGTYQEGLMHGYGHYKYADGAYYEGYFYEGMKKGNGNHTYATGAVYSGAWCDDKPHGKGKYTFANKKVYKGDFLDGNMHGEGMMLLPDNGGLMKVTFENGTLTQATNLDVNTEYDGDNENFFDDGSVDLEDVESIS